MGDGFPRGGQIGRRHDAVLAFAVVTEAGGFKDSGETDLRGGLGEVGERGDAAEGGEGETGTGEECFFAEAMLGGVKNVSGGADGCATFGGGGGGGGNIFKLKCYDGNGGGEFGDSVEVFVGSVDFEVGDLAGWGVFVRGKSVDTVAHAAGGDGEHAPELTAAENTNGAAGQDGLQRLRSPRTVSVCCLR